MGLWAKLSKLLEKWGLIEKSEFDHIRTSDYPHVHFAEWTGLPYTPPEISRKSLKFEACG